MTQAATVDTAAGRLQAEDALAYEMVVALLEYQLSSPVQWIATQDSLLSLGHQDQSFIEIGPSATLATMMKKTLAQLGPQDDAVPECRTFNDELEAIRKASEPEPESEAEEDEACEESAKPVETAAAAAAPVPAPAAAPIVQVPATLAEIADVPPTAADALLAIVASGLKVARATLDTAQSVKFLSKGRSSLQNEIVGNLAAEFGHLPEAVEAMPLAELIQELQPAHSGKLGSYLIEWLNKKVSAKLAPSVSVPKLRAHLTSSYGLKRGHQDTFFLTADFDGISTRLAEQETWGLVAQWADAYMQARNLQRLSQADGQQQPQGPGGQSEAVTSSPQLAKFAQELSTLMSKHFPSQEGEEAEAAAAAAAADDVESTNHLADELGPEFIAGTKPYFRPEMVYRYQSGWNWAVQDLYVTLSAVIARSAASPEEELRVWVQAESVRLRNRKTERLLRCARFLLERWEKNEAGSPASAPCCLLLRKVLAEEDSQPLAEAQLYVPPSRRTIPRTAVSNDGNVTYEEVPVTAPVASTLSTLSDDASPWDSCCSSPPSTKGTDSSRPQPGTSVPVSISTKNGPAWEVNAQLTRQLHEVEWRFGVHGDLPVEGTTLIVGAGQGSIGFTLARLLLQAGCRVAMTTGRMTPENRAVISKMYADVAKPGAELVLLPFNQGSVQDVHNLVEHIHGTLGWEIDHLVPFAAVSAHGKNLEDVDSVSELALRVMLTNTARLMGQIVASKRNRRVLNHSTQVLVPLSPNHGQLGNDGLYAEAKLALEALLNKVDSEPWGDAMAVCGVRMGWARGTGLMKSNNLYAAAIEELGVRTFAGEEMAMLLAFVMTPDLVEACSLAPLLCDFSGGLDTIDNLSQRMTEIRRAVEDQAALGKQLRLEAHQDAAVARDAAGGGGSGGPTLTPSERRARLSAPEPVLPERYEDAVPANSADFEDLFDLDSMVVITGFAELGSAGSSRTRWELEAEGRFSLEGCIELAWMMGFIRYERHRTAQGRAVGPGWVECDSGAPIRDVDVKAKYESHIAAHTGIRLIETDSEAHDNADPRLRDMLHEVGTQEDLPPFDCSSQAAAELRTRHGDAVEVLADDGAAARVRVRRGATIFVPKALNSHYYVAAQMPQGWDATRYGVPQDIAAQTDKPGLYALVCAVEAFLSAGITDVYELYQYIHVSEVGNCIGSGAGGLPAFRRMHEHRLLNRELPADNISEAFVGTAAAWVNLLLLSAAGPIKSGAGTCATSLESLDTACELISSGRTRVCLAGGYDIFSRPVYYEFGEMGAIIDNARDARAGRALHEMSRPFTSTRGGFVLGEGIGLQVVTSASLALEMGLPIYGIVALTHMAADRLGRSVPAPGRGVLTAAKQPAGPLAGRSIGGLLAPAARSRLLRDALAEIDARTHRQVEAAAAVRDATTSDGGAAWVATLHAAAAVEKRAVRRALGQEYWRHSADISPLAGALSVFGLTVDDITFASLHGTATRLNDLNECATLDRQMRHLGRHPGNPLLTVAQKSVVGHGLGASGAYALNGGLQAMHAGVVPGNRNADDIDGALAVHETVLLARANVAMPRSQIKAFTVNSFGFGQKGAQALVVHPRYLLAALGPVRYREYRAKQARRARTASRALDRGLHGQGLFKPHDDPPYAGDGYDYLMDPRARREFP